MGWLPLLLAISGATVSAPHTGDITDAFYQFIERPDPDFSYTTREVQKGRLEINLISQTWQGHAWRHEVLYQQPEKFAGKGTAILYITGDGPRPGDFLDLGLISGATQMPVAMLFDIPNQPLWDMKEDDLIAHTFEKFIETGNADWPLLFPMTKAALRAMDTIQEITKGTDNPINRFVVTGASKRGWTTWFVGASQDKRVVGIAPMVFDNLNVAAQMKHQIDSWGQYSVQIQDYTNRGLQAKLATPIGQDLAAMIDPFTYRSAITMPTLIVNGANDPYWTADALSLYWSYLKQPKYLLTVPNAGHSLGNRLQAVASIGAFSRSIAGDFRMPTVSAKLSASVDGKVKGSFETKGMAPARVILWTAHSRNGDFRMSTWRAQDTRTAPGMKGELAAEFPTDLNVAFFAEVEFDVNGRKFSLSTPTQVFRHPSP